MNPRTLAWMDKDIASLEIYGVTVRTMNVLAKANIQTVSDLLSWRREELFSRFGFGERAMVTLYEALRMCGFSVPRRTEWKIPADHEVVFRDDNPKDETDLSKEELARLVV